MNKVKAVSEEKAGGRTSAIFILGVAVGAGVPLLIMLGS
jgi:hypothetical protein